MICQKKNKRLCAFWLLLLLCLVVVTPLCSSVDSYASETTTQSVTDYFREHNFYDTASYVCRKYASFPYLDYVTGSQSGLTYDAWADWLESKGKSSILNEDVIINNSSGGRGYDLPQDVRQEMLNFVQEVYIDANPLNYTQCYISSYTRINATQFQTYNQFATIKALCEAHPNTYAVMWRSYSHPNYTYRVCFIPKVSQLFMYGTVDNGSFSSVQFAYNWAANSQPQLSITGSEAYTVAVNGTSSSLALNSFSIGSLDNSTSVWYPGGSGQKNAYTVFSTLTSNEMIYVFSSINAFKLYNSNQGQPYYMPSNPQTTVPYYDGFTDSDLGASGNFYNNIVINTEGKSPNDILKTTDSVLGSLDGLFGGSDSESSGGLFDILGDIITGATGAISPIKEIVLGDIKELVADVFDFLPPTIITLWVSGIIFGIFFGVLKLIRG